MSASMFSDPAVFSLVVGLALLAADILILGLSPAMFIAIGAMTTSALLYATGWRPGLLETAALAAVASLVIALVGWRPLRAFQNADVQEDQSSDLIGRELTTTHEVTKMGGVVHWSGAEWRARLSSDAAVDRLDPGARAKVVAVKDMTLVLAPVA